MVKDSDAEKLTGLTEPGGEDTVFGTGCRIPGGMIVRADDGGAIQEDSGFEDFSRMHDAERQGTERNNVHADDGVFGIETGDEELLAVEPGKERTEGGRGVGGIANENKRACMAAVRYQTDSVARNKTRRGDVRPVAGRDSEILQGGLVCHFGTSLLLDSLALSMKPESQLRTTGGDGDVPADEAQADETRAAAVTVFWRGRCAREPERGQATARHGKAIPLKTGYFGKRDEKRRTQLRQERRSGGGAGHRSGGIGEVTVLRSEVAASSLSLLYWSYVCSP
jgi:hypothetical protein